MSDASVRAALRSDAQLVVVEAPAGCGKTHQGADYAQEVAGAGAGRLLILTHTHAACSIFADRTRSAGPRIEIRTIDSMVAEIATAYHAGLGLPADTGAWVRQRGENGYAELAVKVNTLLTKHPMITASLAQRHPIVICDEHQDSSGDQHALAMALLETKAKLRVFGDPMQRIFTDRPLAGARLAYDWSALAQRAQAFERLDYPHRWVGGSPELGQWTLKAREILAAGGRIDLRADLPASVSVVFAENQAQRRLEFRLSANDRRPVDAFVRAQSSLLILTRYNDTAQSLRGFFDRRIELWEGYTRPALETLVDTLLRRQGDPAGLAAGVVEFLGRVGIGFTPSGFGKQFVQEASECCIRPRTGKPAIIQELARFLVTEPDHRGVGKMLRRLADVAGTDSRFSDIKTDYQRELWDAIRLGGFDTPDAGLAEITNRRAHARPKPPDRAISTIHKSKGLECDGVLVMPCDRAAFPEKPDARCVLYVALSRARHQLLLVVPPSEPSPLFII